MTFADLVKLYEKASALENAGELQQAFDLYSNIKNDDKCPKSLLMTVEKATTRIEPKLLVREQSKKESILKKDILDVDVFALESLPYIEEKMPISTEDYNRLKTGIIKRGIINPLIALPNFKLVCGYNRLKIAKEIGLKTVPVIFKNISNDKILEFAMKDNLERRQLSKEQIIEYIADATTQEAGRPKKGSRSKTNKDLANTLGISERTVQRAKAFTKKVKDNPTLKVKSMREVLNGDKKVETFTEKYTYINGVEPLDDKMTEDCAKLIDKIFEYNPGNGDQIKIVTQVYIKRRG